MRKVLLYSPDLVGHPRVYCRAIADALRDEDCWLYLAVGLDEKVPLDSCPDLQPLVGRPRVTLLPTRPFSNTGSNHLRAEEIVALQETTRADCTLFIEADKSSGEFRRIAEGKAAGLRGHRVGIFSNTAEWYPGEDSFTGEPKRIRAKTVRTTLGNVKRLLFERQNSAKYFYERTLLKASVLDVLIVKDERLAAWFGPPVLWMPEISRPVPASETASDVEQYQRISSRYGAFRGENAGREPILYFGDAAFYKGYDLFLEYLRREPAACGVHAGQTHDPAERTVVSQQVERLRERLRGEGRLFETNCYIHTYSLKHLFFGSIDRYLSTHRLTLSSSTCLQALELGKPLLVPDRGLLAHRVVANGLGRTYRYGDVDDLVHAARAFRQEDLAGYRPKIGSFVQRFSDEAIGNFFCTTLMGNP